ncbi:MAG: ABC transporter ATP-binding protein [Desulfotignum sp.]|nr:ABC transporter ATP-binding protein [Desulfotignum sp.]MCF8089379.1 ABC transporter ATP-binding protein [Desulfotignum sp.]
MSMIQIKNLTKTYQQGDIVVTALDHVSVEIEKGEFIAISGPSGSGKTTLLNLMGGLDDPDSGQVIVDGNDFTALSGSRLAELRLHTIGFVFQSYNLIPVLTAAENAEYILRLQGVPKKERHDRVTHILTEVGLADQMHRRPSELSGGQQQRVAVARAVVSSPAMVLADEPTANLDSETGENLLKMMLEMNQQHQVTFIFSTHDHMVMEYARRIITIKDGKIV